MRDQDEDVIEYGALGSYVPTSTPPSIAAVLKDLHLVLAHSSAHECSTRTRDATTGHYPASKMTIMTSVVRGHATPTEMEEKEVMLRRWGASAPQMWRNGGPKDDHGKRKKIDVLDNAIAKR